MHRLDGRHLIITRNLPPLVGGMERLNWHLAEQLSRVGEVRVVGPAGSAAVAPVGVVVREVPLQPLWRFLLRARALARREARVWRPDVVLAGSGLTAPLARAAARSCGAATVAYVHGLDVAVQHPVYRALWLPALRRMDRVIVNSRATARLCRDVGIDPARIGIVHPGVDVPGALPPGAEPDAACGEGRVQSMDAHAVASAAFRKRQHLGDGPLLLSVGRLSARKGLREFVAQALPQIAAQHPAVTLLVVGGAPTDALRAQAQTPDSIRAAAAAAGVDRNIRFLGIITDCRELGKVYGAADVHVFPVCEIAGDPEGFGMVAVEAAAHGLPTVAFATGGVTDAVGEGVSGRLVAPGDYAAFADAVLRTLSRHDCAPRDCVEFARHFAWDQFGARVAEELSRPVADALARVGNGRR